MKKKCPKSKKRVCIKGRGRRPSRCFCARKRR